MSVIEVSDITKLYGKQKAIDGISFTIDKPGIVGLLGPNGAGKSTLMKILCGYIPPSSGIAKVCGFNIQTQSMQVRKRVGYLPEHNPLYEEMYIKEYLKFVGELYRVDNLNKRIEEVIERVKFGTEVSKKISELSKGYRQRVGLSQALLSNPEVLVLDEPTTGLDPNQIEDIRELLREIGNEKTLILSTHIMQEAQTICNRIIMLNKGKVITDASTAELLQKKDEFILRVEFKEELSEELEKELFDLENITKVERDADTYLLFISDSKMELRASIFAWAVNKGLTVITLNKEQYNLESVFHKLISKSEYGD